MAHDLRYATDSNPTGRITLEFAHTGFLRIWRDDTVCHFTGLDQHEVMLFDLTVQGIGSTAVIEGLRQMARRELTSQGYSIVELHS